jgi:hypothetical protein
MPSRTQAIDSGYVFKLRRLFTGIIRRNLRWRHGISRITLAVDKFRRVEAAAVYDRFRKPFLTALRGRLQGAPGARGGRPGPARQLLGRAGHAYLDGDLFTKDVVGGLSPLLSAEPEIRTYETV